MGHTRWHAGCACDDEHHSESMGGTGEEPEGESEKISHSGSSRICLCACVQSEHVCGKIVLIWRTLEGNDDGKVGSSQRKK